MKAQVSFEVLVYLTLAGISLLFGVTVMVAKWQYIVNEMQSLSMSEFVNSVNTEIGGGITSFTVYIPRGACNATIFGNSIKTRYGIYSFIADVVPNSSVFCPDNTYANLNLSYEGDGLWELSR